MLRRKRMILRMLMRRSDPKTALRVLCKPAPSVWKFTGKCRSPEPRCEPAQLECTSTCHKCHFTLKLAEKKPRPRLSPDCRHTHIVRDCAVEMHVNIPQGPLYTGIYRKIAAPQIKPRTQTHSLCQPGQSKCASTFHKSNFIRKFTGKMPRPKTARRLCASLHR